MKRTFKFILLACLLLLASAFMFASCEKMCLKVQCQPTHVHTEVIDPAVAPTCTEPGLTMGKHCAVCNEVLVMQGVVDALGHNFVDVTCIACGEKAGSSGLSYTLSSDGTCYAVSGIGTCTDTDIVIPSVYKALPVTSIAENAFMNCNNLKSVVIPETVTSIGQAAFANCSNLVSVNIPNGITIIEKATFAACNNLRDFSIPDSVVRIEQNAFGHCYFTSITIPVSVTQLDLYAFYYSAYLTTIMYQGTMEQWNSIEKTNVWEGVGIWADNGNPIILCTNGIICTTHTEVTDSSVAPTCVTTGLTEGKHCSVCNEVIVAQTVIDVLGHNYVDGYCSVCDAVAP